MLKLEEIQKDQTLAGVEPGYSVTILSVDFLGKDAAQIVYRRPDGGFGERLLGRSEEGSIFIENKERPFSFDGDGAAFQLACEAKRIDLAFLFDPMMAVHTSNVDPLPHQITAVYQSMLPRQPLRFVLADDPGAGKTIMAGLYIRELMIRADAERILIVAPGGLVGQWQDELYEKFGVNFKIYSRSLGDSLAGENVFEREHRLILRLDQASRNDELQEKILAPGWDLVIFDEAHKLSANYWGHKLDKTARFEFAEKIGAVTRHLLLMTATPHNGKEESFQLFLSLLDSDRFYGKFRDGVHKVDASDLMRRMVKEDLLKFDGTPLFPERRAYTVNYQLSDLEIALYHEVTQYVREEMGKADELDGKRRTSIGFALTALQRRLASSPAAILESLKRRQAKLQARLAEAKAMARGEQVLHDLFGDGVPEDDDDLDAAEREALEETLVDQASASRTIPELEAEILCVKRLVEMAKEVVQSGQDRKWEELSGILQNNPHMVDAEGRRRKLIVFSEHKDTLSYLERRISDVLGNPEAVVTIHGGTHRDERRKVQASFRSDPVVQVLVATDAASEGVNLQNANLMVNYDLPWNPNRLEQRFGRIHRIGQTEVCHLWNLVAKETREGEVFHRLLQKLETEAEALNGRVFDILGEVFDEISLKDLLVQAIRYGDREDVRQKLKQKVDRAFDHQHVTELLRRNALAQETMRKEDVFRIREELEKAEARKLQPCFVRSFFIKAFEQAGGALYPRESGRFEITFVPGALQERDRRLTGRNRRNHEPIVKRYSRICFTKESAQAVDKPRAEPAILMHPGHPLMLSLIDLVLENHANLLRQGAVLIDPNDTGDEPWLLYMIAHEITDGAGQVLSKELQFVRVSPEGASTFAGWAPHLDLRPVKEEELRCVGALMQQHWLQKPLERNAVSLAASELVPEHFRRVSQRRLEHIDRTLTAVHERLMKEIDFQTDRYGKLQEDQAAGKDVRLNIENIRRTITDLRSRLASRTQELKAMRHMKNGTPVVLGGALVVPGGYVGSGLADQAEQEAAQAPSQSAAARKRIELLAMEAVMRECHARGYRVVDKSAEKCGWDLSAFGEHDRVWHIEVKGRHRDAEHVTITRNEIAYGANQGDKFVLAIVRVGENDEIDGPYYIRNVFDREPEWGVDSVNYKIDELLRRAERFPV